MTFVKDDERKFHIKDDPSLAYRDVQKSSFEMNENGENRLILLLQ